MVKLLRQLIRGLSDTVGAWEKFQRKEIGYFLHDGKHSTAPPSLKLSVSAVDKAFSELKELHRKLEELKKELCEDNPQGVSRLLHSEFKYELLY
jgi:hypothetical protein